MEQPKILVIDDEQVALHNLQHILKKAGYTVKASQSGAKALQYLEAEEFDVVLTDLRMPKVDGMEILRRTRQMQPDTEVVIITGYATVDSAIEAMKSGAYHYISKPYKLDEVRRVVAEAVEKKRLKFENRSLKEQLRRMHGVKFIARDKKILELLEMARQVAQSDCSVLITGESGTGKELLARFIHENSERRNGPMLAINCGVFNEELLGNELFGHERGAYTGADRRKIGLIESAQGGTLFLDEITEMAPAMQVKLLRVLQEKEIMRVGSTESVSIDVRFLAASNRDLQQMVEEGEFRQDLYFRINVVNLHLPPLSERRRDIPLLTHFFIDRYAEATGKPVRDISPEALAMLQGYEFPGNVRELENIIERAVVLTRDEVIDVAHLPDIEVETFRPREGEEMPTLEEQERKYISWVLEQTGGNKTRCAEILGIDRVSLWRRLKKYSLIE